MVQISTLCGGILWIDSTLSVQIGESSWYQYSSAESSEFWNLWVVAKAQLENRE